MQKSVKWNGENADEVFDFARPFVFQDYTDPAKPMKFRSPAGDQLVGIGSLIVKDVNGRISVQEEAHGDS